MTPPSRISGVSVIFDFGKGHDVVRGNTHGNISQSEVVDLYGLRLNEELEDENLLCYPINTRKTLSMTEDQRLMAVPGGFLPLIVSCGWAPEKIPSSNISFVEFSGQGYFQMAMLLYEALGEWGKCTVFGHKTAKPIAIESSGRDFIRLKPFLLNGPNAEDYVRRLDSLGVTIGRAISGYFGRGGVGRVRVQSR